MENNPSRQELAAARIKLALNKIEEAQNLLFSACGDLSPIMGVIPNHRRIGKLADAVKAAWYKLDGDRERLTSKGIDRDYQAQYDDKVLRAADGLSVRGQSMRIRGE